MVLLLGIGSSRLYAQEDKYKALYIFNFTKYIDWQDQNEIVLGVVGNSPVLLELEVLVNRNPNIRLKKISGEEGIEECDLVFLPNAQTRNFSLIQSKISNSKIVLVAENEDLINQGAEMAFYKEGDKLRFMLNKNAFDRAMMKVSSSLLAQAKVVE